MSDDLILSFLTTPKGLPDCANSIREEVFRKLRGAFQKYKYEFSLGKLKNQLYINFVYFII